MNGKSVKGTTEVRIGTYEYEKLMKKAEEHGEDLMTILEWLVEEHIDEV